MAQNDSDTAQVLQTNPIFGKMANKGSHNPTNSEYNGPMALQTATGSSKTNTRHNNNRQNGLKYVANITNNLAEKTMWSKSHWKTSHEHSRRLLRPRKGSTTRPRNLPPEAPN